MSSTDSGDSTEATSSANVLFEASTQTPTSEQCDSPLFTPKGYCLKTNGHSNQALINIYKMKQHGQLCDVTLKVGLETFKAHRVVLASVSPYFFAMFNGEMKEHASSEVVLHDIDPTAIELLLDYSYTGQIMITADNVQVLLPASSLLQIQEVREACCRFLMKQLHPTNCLGIRSFADTHSCKELLVKSHCFALQNFQQVVGTEEFLLLPFNEVEELISNSQLNISSEEDVFTAVLNWIKHDLAVRSQYTAKLMVHVRLPLVNREFLMNRVDNEQLIREDGQCRELLLEAMRYHLAPERRCALATPRTTERKPKGAEPYLFAIGETKSLSSKYSQLVGDRLRYYEVKNKSQSHDQQNYAGYNQTGTHLLEFTNDRLNVLLLVCRCCERRVNDSMLKNL